MKGLSAATKINESIVVTQERGSENHICSSETTTCIWTDMSPQRSMSHGQTKEPAADKEHIPDSTSLESSMT
jgi:hypothetical protein